METSNIPEAKERTVGPQQRQGLVDGFFDPSGLVHHEYATRGQTVTKWYYKRVLCRLRNAVRSNDRTYGQQKLSTRPLFTFEPRFFG
jgi:hypothetical protein